MVATSRKHKLGELSSSPLPEDLEPKLKKLKGILDMGGGITCFCDCAKCSDKSGTIDEKSSTSLVKLSSSNDIDSSAAETQTGEELWQQFVRQMFAQQKTEWEKAERVLLKKIEILECDIDKCQELFDRERSNLIKMYEGKLAEKESQLKETQACRSEKRDLQEKWNCLIQELEQFALYLGKNLNEREEEVDLSSFLQGQRRKEAGTATTTLFSPPSELIAMSPVPFVVDDGEERLPTFIGSPNAAEQPGDEDDTQRRWEKDEKEMEKENEMEQKTRLISSLQTSLRDHLSTFEKREKHLLDEIDRLTKEIKESREGREEDNQHHQDSAMIAYLTQENERLKSLFQEHETCWGDLQQLQEEHERLKMEAGNIVAFRRKLEESQKTEAEMRDRLEELERTESNLKIQISQLEKKEQKGLEKIQQLRDEIQFLRAKCCQLQDDLDGRISRETKYKSEIQALTVKLKESSLELEEKESQLESNESALQAQVSRNSQIAYNVSSSYERYI